VLALTSTNPAMLFQIIPTSQYRVRTRTPGGAALFRGLVWSLSLFSVVAFSAGNIGAETQSFSNQGHPTLVLRLKPVAVVESFPVRLSHLGQLDASSSRFAEKVVMENLESPIYLSDDRLKEALLQSGGIESKVYGKGIWVIPLTEKMSASETGEFFEGILENSIHGQGTYRIEAKKGMLYNSKLRSLIKFSGLQPGAGHRNITVDVMDPEDGKRILHRQVVPVRVLQKVRVPVAQRDLKFGETIKEGDYVLEVRYTDGKLKDFSGQNIHGWKLNGPVRKGQVLQAPDIQETPDIRRGQSLDLIYQKPGLVLKIRCVAYGDGNVGDEIPVRILAFNNKTVIKKARIASDRSVIYEP